MSQTIETADTSFFHTPSAKAKALFLYPLCVGFQTVTQGYDVRRTRFDSFLVMIPTEGEGYICDRGRKKTFRSGEVVLLDAYRPHRYGTDSYISMYWLHFDGVQARGFYELCAGNESAVILRPQNDEAARSVLRRICEMFHLDRKINEAHMSLKITELLTILLDSGNQTVSDDTRRQRDALERTLDFIATHLADPITLDEMARQAHFSPFYFLRMFKAETGYTPHRYLLISRLDKAKFLLKSSDRLVKEIAFDCGFSSESAFSAAFKAYTGVTPLSYREDQPES